MIGIRYPFYHFKLLAIGIGLTGPAWAQPEAPEGYRWEINETLTDEFNGTELDATKWYDHLPHWEGRPPGKFMPSSISVADGFLQISMTPMAKPEGKFNIAAGAVQTKSDQIHYGYYEARIKASQLSASTNYWMYRDPIETEAGRIGMELIIQFGIGKSEGFSHHMKSNAMISLSPRENGAKKQKEKRTDRVELKSGVAEDFHTYGCWWVDANTLHFYADGENVYTINPATTFGEDPYRHPLKLSFVCEVFDWQPLPTLEELNDSSRNTAYIDYSRAYRLVKLN
ncbi:MAG: hypothetical protein SynsKO_43560 [Synoicihabitans sp.]